MKTIALLTFIAVYALLLLLPKYRAVSALSAAALFLLLRIVPLGDVAGTVDWNVLMMLAGTMGTVDLFIRSNMPNRLSDRLVAVLPSVKWLIIALALFAGLVSAFVDNVATVLMLAPVGLAISKKLNISPVQPILAIAVSSNLQGAATLVGDTTSILLGGHMGLDFMDFFVYRGRPGLFWVVQAGALMTVPVMLFLFRKEKGKLYGVGTDAGDGLSAYLSAAGNGAFPDRRVLYPQQAGDHQRPDLHDILLGGACGGVRQVRHSPGKGSAEGHRL